MTTSRRCVSLALLALLAAPGCQKAEPEAETRLVVFAAASLRDVFTALGDDFEKTHPGVEITFNFAGTQELRTQLEHGAAVDVFASADQQHMTALVDRKLVTAPVVFARNEPVIVVAREAAKTVTRLADLARAERIVIGSEEVPIGRYTLQILDKASQGPLGKDFRKEVEAHVASRELNVRQVLGKVSLGEADAGVVYRSDAQGKADVAIVAIPPEVNVIAEYPIAVVSNAEHPGLARAWVELVTSPGGQQQLQAAGFIVGQ